MNLTTCPTCKRVVPAERRTRAYSMDGVLSIATQLIPQPHLTHADVFTVDQCLAELEQGKAA